MYPPDLLPKDTEEEHHVIVCTYKMMRKLFMQPQIPWDNDGMKAYGITKVTQSSKHAYDYKELLYYLTYKTQSNHELSKRAFLYFLETYRKKRDSRKGKRIVWSIMDKSKRFLYKPIKAIEACNVSKEFPGMNQTTIGEFKNDFNLTVFSRGLYSYDELELIYRTLYVNGKRSNSGMFKKEILEQLKSKLSKLREEIKYAANLETWSTFYDVVKELDVDTIMSERVQKQPRNYKLLHKNHVQKFFRQHTNGFLSDVTYIKDTSDGESYFPIEELYRIFNKDKGVAKAIVKVQKRGFNEKYIDLKTDTIRKTVKCLDLQGVITLLPYLKSHVDVIHQPLVSSFETLISKNILRYTKNFEKVKQLEPVKEKEEDMTSKEFLHIQEIIAQQNQKQEELLSVLKNQTDSMTKMVSEFSKTMENMAKMVAQTQTKQVQTFPLIAETQPSILTGVPIKEVPVKEPEMVNYVLYPDVHKNEVDYILACIYDFCNTVKPLTVKKEGVPYNQFREFYYNWAEKSEHLTVLDPSMLGKLLRKVGWEKKSTTKNGVYTSTIKPNKMFWDKYWGTIR